MGDRGMENGSASILVVDDDSNCRAMITELLESVRYRTVGAASGEEALRLARKERPAVVGAMRDLVVKP